ncbi:endonuclease domain-containing protein [Variovorax boronicumulans]|uniref:endonuclease domain-containing protein n=1 Tax=Variovorax boronicumulans TaxID=436515 RepID=UPI00339A9D11
MQNQSTPKAQQNARALRHQHPIGNYIADFACLDPKLIVELDGSQHQAQEGYDVRRDAFLRAQGFDVLRFASNDPFVNFEGVLQAVINRLDELKAACPHPNLPPEGEGAKSRSYP